MTNSTMKSHFSTHFFKPLLPDFLTNFSIPKAYLKYLEDDAHQEKIARLKHRGDKIWSVKINNNNEQICFKDGWEKFCKDHDLKVGDFLVFKHQGDRRHDLDFMVSIFDPISACDRDLMHPIKEETKSKKVIIIDLTNEDDEEEEIELDFANQMGDENENESNELSDESSFGTSMKNVDSPTPSCETNGVSKYSKGSKNMSGHKTGGTSKVVFKERGFPYLRTSVKAYCSRWGAVIIDSKFAKENGLANRMCDMVVINEQGQPWKMSLRGNNHSSTYIGNWKQFHIANGLNAGDDVIFEVLDSGEIPVFKFYKLT